MNISLLLWKKMQIFFLYCSFSDLDPWNQDAKGNGNDGGNGDDDDDEYGLWDSSGPFASSFKDFFHVGAPPQ